MRRIGWWLLLALAALALVTLRYFDQNPVLLPGMPEETMITGRPPALFARGDVALLVDRAAIARAAQARAYSATDFSCAWMNVLEAELGPYTLQEAGDVDLTAARAAIVTASAHAAIDAGRLRRFVERGGMLLIDAPDAERALPQALADLAGARMDGRVPFPSVDLLPAGAIAAPDRAAFDRAAFARPPTIARVASAPGLEVLSPLFVRRALGTGQVITATVNVARLFATMLQGAPASDDFRLVERHGDYADIIEPDDLVTDAALRENEVPFADLLARALVALLDPPDQPLPRLLWFPAASRGAFLMTHDEDFRGGAKSLWLAEWGQRLGLRSTTFVISHPRLFEDWLPPGERRPFHQRPPEPDAEPERTDYATRITQVGGAVGLHWNQYPMRYGVGPIEPVEFVMSCADQVDRLRDLSRTTARCLTNRSHYLIQRERWTEAFRVLVANGVRLDSSFGANKGRGYLFGSARPYSILDENGFPLAIRELPFVNQEDWGGADADYFERLLRTNAERHHGAIVSLFHPHLVVLEPAGAALFEHVARTALETGHAPMHFDELLEFILSRERAQVNSRVEAATLVIEATVDRDDLALAIPAAATRRTATREDGSQLHVDRIRIGDREHDRVTLPAGRSTIMLKAAP